jgi:hypothetical protein
MAVADSRQFVEQRLRLFQIQGAEALGEPAVDRRAQVARFGMVALVTADPSRDSRGRAIPRAWPPAPGRC